MDFEEFLLAMGEEELRDQICRSSESNEPLPAAVHEAAMLFYRRYLVVGGMPECVVQFTDTAT